MNRKMKNIMKMLWARY